MEKKMFCYQCQETAGNKGCILKGVCGKDFSTANLMDLLVFNLKGIAIITTAMRRAGVKADYRTADKTIMGITYKHKKRLTPKLEASP